MIDVPDCVESKLGDLVYVAPSWEDTHTLFECSPDNPLDIKASLFTTAGKIRGVVVEHFDKIGVYRKNGMATGCEFYHNAPQAIQRAINRQREWCEKQLARVEKVQSAFDELIAEGKV